MRINKTLITAVQLITDYLGYCPDPCYFAVECKDICFDSLNTLILYWNDESRGTIEGLGKPK